MKSTIDCNMLPHYLNLFPYYSVRSERNIFQRWRRPGAPVRRAIRGQIRYEKCCEHGAAAWELRHASSLERDGLWIQREFVIQNVSLVQAPFPHCSSSTHILATGPHS